MPVNEQETPFGSSESIRCVRLWTLWRHWEGAVSDLDRGTSPSRADSDDDALDGRP